MYLEYLPTLFKSKYSDCVPVTKATNCNNPFDNCGQSEYFPGCNLTTLLCTMQAANLFDYLFFYGKRQQV